jgi:F-type H+-transporting ATPase subunit b
VSNLAKKFIPFVASLVLGLSLVLAAPKAAAQEHTKPAEPAKAAAHAAEGHAEGHETQELIAEPRQGMISAVATLIVFGVVFGVLATVVWPKVLKGLTDRETKIREEIESAEQARKKAKDALDQYNKSLADARAEAAKMLETTRAQQAQLATDLKNKADAELAIMKERALKDIDSAKRAAVAEIYNLSAQLAATMAGKILRRSVSVEDTQQLVEESLRELQASRN